MSRVRGIPYVAGQWVRGDQFYGRAAQIEEILNGPRNCLWLLGTRRLGKTSLLKQLEHLTASSLEAGYFPIFWDFQGAENARELHDNFADALLDAEERLERVGISLSEVENDNLFSSLSRLRRCLRSRTLKLLLLCDEVEELITIGEKEPSLLRKIRRALQSPDDIRSVLASTIRLWELAQQKADTSPFLNGFTPPLYIGTLIDDEARELIRQTHLSGESRPAWDSEAVETIRERCDNHPYLIQLVCKRYLESGDLKEAFDEVATDQMVSFFFSVDFDMLSTSDRGILKIVCEHSATNSDSIQGYLSIDAGALRGSLARLENLAFIRRNPGREFVLANKFFEQWLRDLSSDLPQVPSASSFEAVAHAGRTAARVPGLDVIEDRYQLQEKVGEGATGIVYRAYDQLLSIEIAIKLLRPHYIDNEAAVERFRQEILLSRDIAHPNILRTYHLGEFRGVNYLTMQWIEGPTLAEKIGDDAPFSIQVCLDIATKVASALEAAHARKILHRDVKPQNILLDKTGEPYLTDFGVARLLGKPGITRGGVFLGTPDYASPEQANLLPLDERSDVYALGIVLFEMVTGTKPFVGDNSHDVLEMHRSAPPKELPSHTPAALSDLILCCLEKDPAKRLPDARSLRQALEAVTVEE